MPTVIDSLIITLGLNAANFTQGQKAAVAALQNMQYQATQSGTALQAHGAKMTHFFQQLKMQALGLVGALMGAQGIKAFLTTITNTDAAVGRVAKTLNMSVEQLSAWRNVAKQTGGSAEEMTGALQGMSGELNKLAAGMGTHIIPLLNSLQVSTHKSNGQLKTAGELFFDLSAAVEKLDPAQARTRLAGLGLPDSVINTLLIGRTRLADLYDEQVKLGIITKEDAERAQELQTAWEEASTAAVGLGRTILNYLTPALSGLLQSWTKTFKELNQGQFISPDSWLGQRLGIKPMAAPPGPTAPRPGAPGLTVSSTAGVASTATSGAMSALAGLSGIDRVTALNDAYHRLLGAGHHTTGNAMDVTAVGGKPKSQEVADAISKRLTEAGIAHRIRNEYIDPSKGSTGGHIHVTIIPPGGGATGAAGAAAVRNSVSNRGGDTNSTNIDNLNVIVPGGDAPTIARALPGAIQNQGGISPMRAATGQW